MKTSTLFFFLLLLASAYCQGQKQYTGVYAGSHTLKLEMKVSTDEATDSVLKQVNKDSVKSLFSSMLESRIETRIFFTANETASLIDIEVSSKPSFVEIPQVKKRYLYLESMVYLFNSADKVFQPDTKVPTRQYSFTGRTKTILGYTCHEAMISSPGHETGTAWICKELPASISPGIILQGSPGAVFEFSNTSLKSELTELTPSDTPELRVALESIRK